MKLYVAAKNIFWGFWEALWSFWENFQKYLWRLSELGEAFEVGFWNFWRCFLKLRRNLSRVPGSPQRFVENRSHVSHVMESHPNINNLWFYKHAFSCSNPLKLNKTLYHPTDGSTTMSKHPNNFSTYGGLLCDNLNNPRLISRNQVEAYFTCHPLSSLLSGRQGKSITCPKELTRHPCFPPIQFCNRTGLRCSSTPTTTTCLFIIRPTKLNQHPPGASGGGGSSKNCFYTFDGRHCHPISHRSNVARLSRTTTTMTAMGLHNHPTIRPSDQPSVHLTVWPIPTTRQPEFGLFSRFVGGLTRSVFCSVDTNFETCQPAGDDTNPSPRVVSSYLLALETWRVWAL